MLISRISSSNSDLQLQKIAFTLRPKVHSPKEIVKLAKSLDSLGVSNVFIPDIPDGFDSLEISSAVLSNTERLYVGSGVIRALEHEDKLLFRRTQTIQSISNNRFVLGVGTGSPGPDPKSTIDSVVLKLRTLRERFSGIEHEGVKMPRTFFATLKPGIANRVAGSSDGILLNFCSPEYARRLISNYRENFKGETEFACYLKVFYSQTRERALRLLVEEFANYNRIPSYHKMFVLDGIASEIESAQLRLQSGKDPDSKSKLFQVSLANPTVDELKKYVAEFRSAGVSLPCIYPYFSPADDFEYRSSIVKSIASAL